MTIEGNYYGSNMDWDQKIRLYGNLFACPISGSDKPRPGGSRLVLSHLGNPFISVCRTSISNSQGPLR